MGLDRFNGRGNGGEQRQGLSWDISCFQQISTGAGGGVPSCRRYVTKGNPGWRRLAAKVCQVGTPSGGRRLEVAKAGGEVAGGPGAARSAAVARRQPRLAARGRDGGRRGDPTWITLPAGCSRRRGRGRARPLAGRCGSIGGSGAGAMSRRRVARSLAGGVTGARSGKVCQLADLASTKSALCPVPKFASRPAVSARCAISAGRVRLEVGGGGGGGGAGGCRLHPRRPRRTGRAPGGVPLFSSPRWCSGSW